MRANQLEETSSPTSERRRSLTRDQLSCSPFDIVFFSIRLNGWTDSVARLDGGTANAPETGRNSTRLMASSEGLGLHRRKAPAERHRREVERRCASTRRWRSCAANSDRECRRRAGHVAVQMNNI